MLGIHGVQKKGQIVFYLVFRSYLTTSTDTTVANVAPPHFTSLASQLMWDHCSRILGYPVWPHLSPVVGITNTDHSPHLPFEHNCVGNNVLRWTPLLDPSISHVWSHSNMTFLVPFANDWFRCGCVV